MADDDRPINPAAFRRAFNRAADREVARRARLDRLRAAYAAFNNNDEDDPDDAQGDANLDGADFNEDNGGENSDDGGGNQDDGENPVDGGGNEDSDEEGVENEQEFPEEPNSDSDSESNHSADSNDENEIVQFNDEHERGQYVRQGLRDWAIEGGVMSMRKLDKLLTLLHPVFPTLPLSYKTLLETPTDIEVVDVEGGQVWYKGIRKNLDSLDLQEYLELYNCITLDFNFDGLPIFNQSPKKFWPGLGRLVHSKNEPFIISIFFGEVDPSSDVLLQKLVEEILILQHNGFQYRGGDYEFKIRHYICDAPARAKIKGIVEHGGYYACEKCEVEGEWIADRMTYLDINARLRTDESFINREQEDHHNHNSLLEQINWGPVSQFRLDAMHLVHLGAYKRLLSIWKSWNGPWKLNQNQIAAIDQQLAYIRPTIPSDFNRKTKYFLSKLYLLKATELRRSLLYDGVVKLKREVNVNAFKHYLLLHCGIYILSSPTLCHEKNEIANEMLRLFIEHGAVIYGEKFVVYNIHSLCHLAAECADHNNLDCFSAYEFENKLKSIKSSLKSGYMPLKQAAYRDLEKTVEDVVLENMENHIALAKPHFLANEIMPGDQYGFIQVNGVKFNRNQADSCFKTVTGDVGVLHNIVKYNDEIYFIGYTFETIEDLYEYPIRSSDLGILKVSELGEERKSFQLAEINAKCWLMPTNEEYQDFASFPLLHSVPLLH